MYHAWAYDSPAGPYDKLLQEGDTVSVLGVDFEVMSVPGHTLDHIAYFSASEGALLWRYAIRGGLRTCFRGKQQANACIIREVGRIKRR